MPTRARLSVHVVVVVPMVRVQARPVVPNAIGAGRGAAIVLPPQIPAAHLQQPMIHPLWTPDTPYRHRCSGLIHGRLSDSPVRFVPTLFAFTQSRYGCYRFELASHGSQCHWLSIYRRAHSYSIFFPVWKCLSLYTVSGGARKKY